MESTDTAVVVDLDLKGIDPNAASLTTLQLLDERGVRIAERVAVRKNCRKPCGDESDDECHVEGQYRYSGPPVAQFAVAFEAKAWIRPHPLDRSPLLRVAQLGHLAQLFASPGQGPVESETLYSWRRADPASDWEEQYAWLEEVRRGRRQLSVAKTGSRFAACSLTVFGLLTEFDCQGRRSIYLGDRHVGAHDDPALTSVVRYSAQVDGTLAHFLIVSWNSATHVRIVFRLRDEWHEDGVENDRAVC